VLNFCALVATTNDGDPLASSPTANAWVQDSHDFTVDTFSGGSPADESFSVMLTCPSATGLTDVFTVDGATGDVFPVVGTDFNGRGSRSGPGVYSFADPSGPVLNFCALVATTNDNNGGDPLASPPTANAWVQDSQDFTVDTFSGGTPADESFSVMLTCPSGP
jgi:hypothetical protein